MHDEDLDRLARVLEALSGDVRIGDFVCTPRELLDVVLDASELRLTRLD